MFCMKDKLRYLWGVSLFVIPLLFSSIISSESTYILDNPHPHLSIIGIEGGIGVTVKIKNDGNVDLNHVTLNVEVSNGEGINIPEEMYEKDNLKTGEVWVQKIHIYGLNMGFSGSQPEFMFTVLAPHAHLDRKGIAARVIGVVVIKTRDIIENPRAFKGYTLFSPMVSKTTYLINNSGDILHTWERPYIPGKSVYLLEDGRLLRTACPYPNPNFPSGGVGGRIEVIDWNGTLLWYFELSNETMCLHHDVEMLPNGNILAIAWEYKSYEEAVKAGRNPDTVSPQWGLWPDCILEIKPIGESGYEIVWEWHMWDHLIQDFDPSKDNYGDVSKHPELIDINYPEAFIGGDIAHINSIDYNEEFDQVLLSVHEYNEIWVIDHSTTLEEAAGHSGGRYGRGGDLLYRWGNPQTYRAGTVEDQRFFGQHDAQWIDKGSPGEGNILVFNNGWGRPDGRYSTVEEIIPPVDENGFYHRKPNSPFPPRESFWVYKESRNGERFFSFNIAGAQRLPNGNTLICSGQEGLFFEVTMDREVVWKYLNLFPTKMDNQVFKIRKYPPDYPGLKNLFG